MAVVGDRHLEPSNLAFDRRGGTLTTMSEHFVRRTMLDASCETAFDLSLDVDFHLASFSESGEQVVGGVTAGGMNLGDVVTWRARHFGIWWKMTTKITEFDRPHRFVDEQIRGPFKSFRHVHTFVQTTQTTTEMIDVIEFSAPLGVFGKLAERAVLGRYVPRMIDTRNEELKEQTRRMPS